MIYDVKLHSMKIGQHPEHMTNFRFIKNKNNDNNSPLVSPEPDQQFIRTNSMKNKEFHRHGKKQPPRIAHTL